jgi:pimeloyl-ACP methyl ester carboxylesterase
MRKLLFVVLCIILSAPTLAQDATPRFEPSDCPFDIPEGEVQGQTIDCGTLIVLEDHNNPSSPEIQLAVVTLHSTGNPEPDPIVYLEGGPGESALSGVDSWLDSPFLENRDLILFDQRGTGYSIPNLNCPELDSPDDEAAATQACHDRLTNAGVNLADYNSDQSAADVADLAQAMGYTEVNLLGISYGTRLGLVVMRDTPQIIRSVILDSIYPPQIKENEEYAANQAHAFQTLLDGCAADSTCNQAYPDLENVLAKTVDDLNANPATYTDASGQDATLSGNDLIEAIFKALYDANLIPKLPRVIYQVSQGDYSGLDELNPDAEESQSAQRASLRLALRQDTPDTSSSEGMDNSVQCTEEVPFNDEQKSLAAIPSMPEWLQSDAESYIQQTYSDCQIWNVPEGPAKDKQPVVSDIPTLLLSGEYDPVTPAHWGQETAQTLSNGHWFEFPGIGHDTIDNADCPKNMAATFYDDPTTEPDSSCIADMAPPAFETP